MMVPAALLLLGALAAVVAPRLLARADWPDHEPVLALWVWQCVVAAVLLCCALSMTLSAAAAWQAVRGHVFANAPHGVVDAYPLVTVGPWAATTAVVLACGGAWTAAMLVREVVRARARRLSSDGPNSSCAYRCCPASSPVPSRWSSWRGAPRRLVDGRCRAPTGHHHGRVETPQGAPAGLAARARTGARAGPARLAAALLGRPRERIPAGTGVRRVPGRDAPAGRTRRRRHGLPPLRPPDDRPRTGRTQRGPGVFGPCPTPHAHVPQRVNRLLTPRTGSRPCAAWD